jgi:hypothetical protein
MRMKVMAVSVLVVSLVLNAVVCLGMVFWPRPVPLPPVDMSVHPPEMPLFCVVKVASRTSVELGPRGISHGVWLSTVLDPSWYGRGNEPPHRLFVEVDLNGAEGVCQGCEAFWDVTVNGKLERRVCQVSEFDCDECRELAKVGRSFWYSRDHSMDGEMITFKWFVSGADVGDVLRKSNIRFYCLERK